MSETIHKGWLETRDGEKFAPITLIENVNTRSGKPYDQHVREYINSLNSKLNNKVNIISAENAKQDEKIKELQDKESNLSENISKQIVELQNKDTEFANKLQYFDGSASDTLYIIDNNNKIVAYINGNGIYSTEYTNKNGITFSNIINRLKACEDELAYVDTMANNEAFYFIDNNNNVIAKIDETGISAIDFTAKDQTYSLVGLNAEVKTNASGIDALKGRTATVENKATTLETRANTLENNLKTYYGYEHLGQDAFYFIDNSNNIVAMVDAAGITTTNITFANTKNAKQNMMFFEEQGTINITF